MVVRAGGIDEGVDCVEWVGWRNEDRGKRTGQVGVAVKAGKVED